MAHAGGRPAKLKNVDKALLQRAAALGLTEVELSRIFDVNPATLNEYKFTDDKFNEALKKGKAYADGQVVKSLFKRAMGYRVSEETIEQTTVMDPSGKDFVLPAKVTRTVVKEVPPDVTAQIFWLKNRLPEQWRDRIEHDVNVKTFEQIKKLQDKYGIGKR